MISSSNWVSYVNYQHHIDIITINSLLTTKHCQTTTCISPLLALDHSSPSMTGDNFWRNDYFLIIDSSFLTSLAYPALLVQGVSRMRGRSLKRSQFITRRKPSKPMVPLPMFSWRSRWSPTLPGGDGMEGGLHVNCNGSLVCEWSVLTR